MAFLNGHVLWSDSPFRGDQLLLSTRTVALAASEPKETQFAELFFLSETKKRTRHDVKAQVFAKTLFEALI